MLQDTGGEYGRPEQGKEKPFSEKWKERRKKIQTKQIRPYNISLQDTRCL